MSDTRDATCTLSKFLVPEAVRATVASATAAVVDTAGPGRRPRRCGTVSFRVIVLIKVALKYLGYIVVAQCSSYVFFLRQYKCYRVGHILIPSGNESFMR